MYVRLKARDWSHPDQETAPVYSVSPKTQRGKPTPFNILGTSPLATSATRAAITSSPKTGPPYYCVLPPCATGRGLRVKVKLGEGKGLCAAQPDLVLEKKKSKALSPRWKWPPPLSHPLLPHKKPKRKKKIPKEVLDKWRSWRTAKAKAGNSSASSLSAAPPAVAADATGVSPEEQAMFEQYLDSPRDEASRSPYGESWGGLGVYNEVNRQHCPFNFPLPQGLNSTESNDG